MISKKGIIFLIFFQFLIVPVMIAIGSGGFLLPARVELGDLRADLSFPGAKESDKITFPTVSEKTMSKEARPQNNAGISIDSIAPVALEGGGTGLRFEGRAAPDAFISVHIFSVPMVATAKADGSGRWVYVFARNLDDGWYLAYAASGDSGAAILSRSPDFIFTKKGTDIARALAGGEAPSPSSVKELKNDFAYSTVLAILLAFTAALVVIGLVARRAGEKG